jgi:DNA-binding NarL/FixJ family response regulator
LLVEDHEQTAITLGSALRTRGYQVEYCSTWTREEILTTAQDLAPVQTPEPLGTRASGCAWSARERLTRREQEVLIALIDGQPAQSIADETFTSVRTVRGHIQSVLDKLGVSSQLTAVAKAREAGWPHR